MNKNDLRFQKTEMGRMILSDFFLDMCQLVYFDNYFV